jgi:hypothetical protein
MFNYDEFVKWQMEIESIKEYTEIFEIIPEKNILLVTFNMSLREKHIFTNMLIIVDYKLIVKKVTEFNLFLAELEIFQVDETSKFFEFKRKTTSTGIIHSLKIKGTNIYLNKHEVKALIKKLGKIERSSKYGDHSTIKRCEDIDYINQLLIKSNIINE